MTRRGSGLWVALGLLLVGCGLAYVTIELVQRRRFAVLGADVESAILEFQSTATFRKVMQGSTVDSPDIVATVPYGLTRSVHDRGQLRSRSWDLRPLLRDPLNNEVDTDLDAFSVSLMQWRDLLLYSPRIVIFSADPWEQPFLPELDAVLKKRGLAYVISNRNGASMD